MDAGAWRLRSMTRRSRRLKKIAVLRRLLPSIAFLLPILLLYHIYPESFEATWKGRAFHLFFLWLSVLETVLGWDKLPPATVRRRGIVAVTLPLLLPTLYVVLAHYGGVNAVITEFATQHAVYWAHWMALSVEYLVFAGLLSLILWLEYGRMGLRTLLIAPLFSGFIGGVYLIDNLYPFGRFTPLQLLVPATTFLAAQALNVMGYQTRFLPLVEGMPTLVAGTVDREVSFQIAWPCSGVESLFLYAMILLLFLKRTALPRTHKMIAFLLGAAVTYLINVLRVATLFVIAMNDGDWVSFHHLYGPLYSILWITMYPLIITGSYFLRRHLQRTRHV
jgi:thaumarchaeosortase